ncbi:MAG TPA: MarR family transcriptional regulator [Acidimicrobiales bacterium]|nr:MarR family transcriptional regulator [Acidimicrobiales bacterium]
MAKRKASGAAPISGTANRLGALALALTDRTDQAVAEAAGGSETAAASLSALHHFLEDPSIELLARVVGLSHSGAVRLVDRLERDQLVRRQPGPDRRSTVVSLTDAGRGAAGHLGSARAQVLDAALEALSPSEQEVFDGLIGRVLVSLMREPGTAGWMCRLCDTDGCGRSRAECPVANEAVARYAIDLETSPS